MISRAIVAATAICLTISVDSYAYAQSWQMNTQSFALKSGEVTEVADLYWVINCKSQLTGLPEVTVLDGPPGVTASVAEAMVVPRFQQCSKPVSGGKLKLTVGAIQDESDTRMTLRIKYKTKDGDRDRSMTFSIALFP